MRRILKYRKLSLLLLLIGILALNSAGAGEFTIARVKYGGGGDWYGDPSSLVNLLRFIRTQTGLPTSEKESVVSLTDDNLFSFPFLYLTGHGNISLDDSEAENLREYLLGGGFMHVDDNYGLDESFRRELKKVFPHNDLVEIPFYHPIYHIAYDFSGGLPKIHEHDGKPAQGFAILVNNRIALFYTYECDLGDGWEDPEVHDDPPEKHVAALKMGTNIVLYALTGQPSNLP